MTDIGPKGSYWPIGSFVRNALALNSVYESPVGYVHAIYRGDRLTVAVTLFYIVFGFIGYRHH